MNEYFGHQVEQKYIAGSFEVELRQEFDEGEKKPSEDIVPARNGEKLMNNLKRISYL